MTTYSLNYYRDALAGKKPPIHADYPQPGYYRLRDGKKGPYLPVAIWEKDGNLLCRVGAESRDPLTIWTWCADNPVEKDAAKEAFATGKWPGDVDVPESQERGAAGDNSQHASIIEEACDYITRALEWLDKVGKVDTEEKSNKAANYAAHIVELKGKVDRERDEKVRPHLDAQRDINKKYKPYVESAEAAAKKLKGASGAFLIEQKRKAEAEAEAKYQRELAAKRIAEEENRKRVEAEKARAVRAGIPAEAVIEPEPEVIAEPVKEVVRVQAGGQSGRKVTLVKVVRWEMENYDLVLAAVRTHMDVIAAVEKAATALCKAGQNVPGMKRVETEEAR